MEFPEKITFLGIECLKNVEASNEPTGAVYLGRLMWGDLPWFTVNITGTSGSHSGRAWAVSVRGRALHLDVQGRHLDRVEMDMKFKLSFLHRDMEVLSQADRIADSSVAAALFRFGKDWEKLPPLVRAGAAHALFMQHQKGLREESVNIRNSHRQGFTRRTSVRSAFRSVELAFLDLLGPLIKQADREAEALGIDCDIEPAPAVNYSMGDMAELLSGHSKESMEKDLDERMSTAIAAEVDADIADQLAKQAEKPE